jgi:hypothetical protein
MRRVERAEVVSSGIQRGNTKCNEHAAEKVRKK